jgi:GT2 family glycosyltransferase
MNDTSKAHGNRMNESKVGTGRIAIIVLSVNQREKTLRCLESLHKVEKPHYRIFLWDNGSTDGTIEAVQEFFPNVVVHHHPVNCGAAAGRNKAAELAIQLYNPAFFLFIDNDMTVTPGFLEALVRPFESHNRLAQTTGKIKVPGDEKRLNDAGGCHIQFHLGRTFPVGYGEIDHGQYDVSKKCVPGGFSLVRVEIFQQVGGFDTAFDPYAYEDIDFSLRIASAGYYALYVPEAVVFHEVTQTFEAGEYTEKYARNKAKNWFLFMSRHASPFQKLGFYLLGLPYMATRAVVREVKKGNIKALLGLLRGAVDHIRTKTSAH